MHAVLHKKVVVTSGDASIVVTLDIVPDDEAPYAVLTARTARDRDGPALATVRVEAGFKLSDASAVEHRLGTGAHLRVTPIGLRWIRIGLASS